MRRKVFICLIIMAIGIISSAQELKKGQVGINTEEIHPTEVFKVYSPNKGVLLPRINLTSLVDKLGRNSLPNYLMVYNKNETLGKGFFYWNGERWQPLLREDRQYGEHGVKLFLAKSQEAIKLSSAQGEINFLRGESFENRPWILIPGLEKSLKITNIQNNLIIAVGGNVLLHNAAPDSNAQADYFVGIFIDNSLLAVKEFSVDANDNCGINSFSYNLGENNLPIGEHSLKVAVLLKQKTSSLVSLNLAGNLSQCQNQVSNDMLNSFLSIKISQ